ncbi:Nidogen-like [Roseivivax marinus]|nr:Nidogen-like [Roseivivax marinus]
MITGVSNNPEITPYFADVDTRNEAVPGPTPGGNSTGTNLVYYDFDEANDRIIITWDDVGYFSRNNDLLNAFQLILTDRGDGDFDIQFRYEDVQWTTGNASGGSGGFGGTPARAGYTAGTGEDGTFSSCRNRVSKPN